MVLGSSLSENLYSSLLVYESLLQGLNNPLALRRWVGIRTNKVIIC